MATCGDCGRTAEDVLSEGVDPEFWLVRDESGGVLCLGCQAIRTAGQRFADGDW